MAVKFVRSEHFPRALFLIGELLLAGTGVHFLLAGPTVIGGVASIFGWVFVTIGDAAGSIVVNVCLKVITWFHAARKSRRAIRRKAR